MKTNEGINVYDNVGSGSNVDDAFLLMQAAHFSSASTNLLFTVDEFDQTVVGVCGGGDWKTTFYLRSASKIVSITASLIALISSPGLFLTLGPSLMVQPVQSGQI